MGTNYYLHRKSDPCGECGHEKNEPVEIHIGKSSMGWVWLWQGYKADGELGRALAGPDDWFPFLAEEVAAGAQIRDEYSQDVALDELRERVVNRRGQRQNSRDWTEHVGGDDVSYSYFR
jgi:hypothetical protein